MLVSVWTPLQKTTTVLAGDGDGPFYVEGPFEVVGDDKFDLDFNKDGTGCEK